MKVHFLKNHTIRVRFISVVLILILIFSMSYVLLFEQLKQEQQSEVEKNMFLTEMVASSLDDFISGQKSVLEELALLDDVKQEQRAEVSVILQDFAHSHPEASSFWVFDKDGERVAQYPENKAYENLKDQEYWKRIKENTFVGGPYIEQVTGKEVIIVTKPYYRGKQKAGIVGISIPLSALQVELDKINVGQLRYVTLITREDGQVLSHPNLEQYRKTYSFEASLIYQELKVKNLTSGYFENNQEQLMHTFIELKEAPWVAIVAQPLYEFNFKRNQYRERNLIFLVWLFLFMSLIIHYSLMLRDIRHAEKNMQTEKLALVGELAAGIAHEIRNPLTSIKGFTQLIYEKRGQDIPSYYYETILEELDRIDQIVGELVVLAKPAPEKKKEVDLSKVVQDSVKLMNYQACLREVELVLNIEPELPHIEGNMGQLKQVFINLIKNAIEAIENKGTVTIQARRQGDRVMITVEDTGAGMDNAVIERLGNPFFTTKEKGTGLGLIISYRIIQNHKGKVSVQSKVGIGTQFVISLPSSSTIKGMSCKNNELL